MKRCSICTGCGRCDGVRDAVTILTASPEDRLQCPVVSLENPSSKRLVTVDIGTTTIAMQLFGTDGLLEDEFVCVNPQTAYGADVMSRISASADRSKAEDMGRMVREVLRKGYEKFQGRLSYSESGSGSHFEESLFAVLAANTTMVYLLMGYDPGELGEYPFAAGHLHSIHTEIAGVETVIFPGFSAFVGGDIAAGLYAGMGAMQDGGTTLFIDLGTNGEIALVDEGRILCCGTAAGPAFEGGVNRGVWGSDMLNFLAELKEQGIMDDTGLLADQFFDGGIRIGDVLVTQESIRAIQLAKAAIAAGIRILAGEKKIDRIILAGGFGYYLNPDAAIKLKLFGSGLSKADTDAIRSKIKSGGNTALLGAYRLGAELLCGKRTDIESIHLFPDMTVEVVNLAEVDAFHEIYIDELNF